MPVSDGARAAWPGREASPVGETNVKPVGRPAPVGTWPHALSHEPLLRVSDVLAAVQPEFPTLTPSKLRFLDAEGLVTPQRTAGRYRHYSPSDVERLRFVLRQQRDHFQPLTVIAERLEALDRGEAQEGIVPLVVGEEEHRWLEEDALAARAGVTIDVLRTLVAEGVIREGRSGRFSHDDVGIVQAAGEYLAKAGDVRALRAVIHAARQEAERHRVAVAPIKAKGAREEAADAFRTRSEAAATLFTAVLRCEQCD